MKSFCLIALLLTTLAGPAVRGEESSIAILPGAIKLNGSGDQQRVSVVTLHANRVGPQLAASDHSLKVLDPQIATLENNLLRPVADGTTKLIATNSAGATASIDIEVTGMQSPIAPSFRHDIQSILARQGCSMGACHGALAGKGGFRLSLRGYDAEFDYQTIVRELGGRRVQIERPAYSLLLTKPTGALPHKGGLRLDVQSSDYRKLADWIGQGAKGPSTDDPKLTEITVQPVVSFLHPKDQTQLLVQAHYSDGRVRDVTHWAKFSATDEAVAMVDEHGKVSVQGSGESAVMVWFGSQVTLARMTVPFAAAATPPASNAAPPQNFIDDLNREQLALLQLTPAAPIDDAAFIRRASIDTIGRLPTVDEAKAYINDAAVDKKARLVDRLLASDDFISYWTYKWSDMLLINGTKLRPAAVETYYKWVRESIKQNKPWDQLVREIMVATGESNENGATNFYAVQQTPEEMAENACQAFMGLSIGCAKCHNHPLEKWTNDQYYALANMFSRVRAKGWGGEPRSGDGLRTLYVATSGELIQPNRGRPQKPAPLDAPEMEFEDPRDRRVVFADWLTHPSNPYFARSITNRVWANFFGLGLVETVDDMRLSNPASNEPLLSASAAYLVKQQFDLKQLMRVILNSETYGRSSEFQPLRDGQTLVDDSARSQKYLASYYPRRMQAEVLLDAIDQVLETSSSFTRVEFPGADFQETKFYPKGTGAIELYDSAVESYFLKTFGRNPREITCECERTAEPSMVQVLHLSNGDTLNPKLADPNNLISRLLNANTPNEAILDELFWRALSRSPSTQEQQQFLSVLAEYGTDRRAALEDACWSILATTEFTFNH